jgi:hypothetical protein
LPPRLGRAKALLLRQPGEAQGADHLVAISGVEADELIKCIGFANRHSRIHFEKRRDMLLDFVDAAEKRQGVGKIEMR